MPQISVIIPNYNHELYLKLRIDSVLKQTFQNIEIIILDDCSNDASKHIIESYRKHPKISKIVYNSKNSGSTFNQWEKGIHLASSDWIWIAESDDYADPYFLESLYCLTSKYNNVGIALSNSYKVHEDERVEDLYEYMTAPFKLGTEEVKQRLCHYNTITNVSACIINKKQAINAIKGLGKYRTCGDWIFYNRLLQHSNLAYSPKKLNYYRWHHNNISYSACKSRAYISEGVNVINDIDYKLINFSVREFLALVKGWSKKAIQVNFSESIKSLSTIVVAIFKFSVAKFPLKNGYN